MEQPPQLELEWLPGQDKLAHAVLYAGLALTLRWWLVALAPRRTELRLDVVAWTATLLYGVTDEAHQLLVPGREVEAWDLVADAGGALLALACVRRLLMWRARAPVEDHAEVVSGPAAPTRGGRMGRSLGPDHR